MLTGKKMSSLLVRVAFIDRRVDPMPEWLAVKRSLLVSKGLMLA
jgi:hypothetical protein